MKNMVQKSEREKGHLFPSGIQPNRGMYSNQGNNSFSEYLPIKCLVTTVIEEG